MGTGYCIDETGFALQLVAEGRRCHLSPPWRCGDNLFVDTLNQVFDGMAFELYRDWTVACPVTRLDFGAGRVGQDEGQHATRL